MPLLIVGLLFLALGLFAGTALVVAPMGLGTLSAGLMLWIIFPLFSIVGYVMFVIGAKVGNIRLLSSIVSWLLLLLAMAAAIGLVLVAASIVTTEASTLSLWYVLVIAGMLGGIGAAANIKASEA